MGAVYELEVSLDGVNWLSLKYVEERLFKHARVTISNEYGDILAISEAATVEVKAGE